MVGTGKPKRLETFHALISDYGVLNGIVEGVSHMKLPRDIGRRNDNGKRLFVLIGLSVKILFVQPFFVDSVLEGLRVVCLVHNCSEKIVYGYDYNTKKRLKQV